MNLEQPLAQFCEYLAQVLKLRKQVIRTSLGVAAHAQAFRRFECLMNLDFEWSFTPRREMRCLPAAQGGGFGAGPRGFAGPAAQPRWRARSMRASAKMLWGCFCA